MNILIGSHGVGKSTLLKEFQKRVDGRYYVGDGFSRPIHFFTSKYSVFFPENYQQLLLDELTIWRWREDMDKKCLYARSILDSFIYSKTLLGVEKKQLKEEFLRDWKRLENIFYIPIEFEIEKDGVRYEDIELQKEIDEKMRGFLVKENISFIVVRGSVEERVKILFKHIIL